MLFGYGFLLFWSFLFFAGKPLLGKPAAAPSNFLELSVEGVRVTGGSAIIRIDADSFHLLDRRAIAHLGWSFLTVFLLLF
jgi:hypothetical protein